MPLKLTKKDEFLVELKNTKSYLLCKKDIIILHETLNER